MQYSDVRSYGVNPYTNSPNVKIIESQVTRTLHKTSRTTHVQPINNQDQIDLLGKILLLELELGRKDYFTEAFIHSSQEINGLTARCHQLEFQNQELNKEVAELRIEIANAQSEGKGVEMYKSKAKFNQELEEKVSLLQQRLRNAQDEKIQAGELNKKLKIDLSMASFSLVKNEGAEKSRLRELENEFIGQRNKLEAQRRINREKEQIIELLKARETRDKQVIFNYENRLRTAQHEVAVHEKMKNSHIAQEKLTIIKDENSSLQDWNHQLKMELQQKNNEIEMLILSCRSMEINRNKSQMDYRDVLQKNEMLRKELEKLEKSLTESAQVVNEVKLESSELRSLFSQQCGIGFAEELTSIHKRIQLLNVEAEILRGEQREMRQLASLKAVCENCKIREKITSVKSIKSTSRSKMANLNQLISTTQQLQRSNLKMESLISLHGNAALEHKYSPRKK